MSVEVPVRGAGWHRAHALVLLLPLALLLHGERAVATPDAGVANDAPPTVDASTPLADTLPAGSTVPAGATVDPLDDPATPDEDAAARAALGPDENPPDPIAEEADRTGVFEGPAPSGDPVVATEIAALTDRQCLRALARARVPFDRVRHPVPGVVLPVRVTGAIHGVTFRASGAHTVDELMDCRLAVALVRFTTQLRTAGVREVRHLSLYRPPSPRDVLRHPIQTRHPGGMAIDAATFIRDDGTSYEVERDFHGRRHRPPCGPTTRVPALPAARFIRSIVCDAARRGTFHVLLTPDFNYEHRNHFHLEVARGVSWQFVR